MGLEGFANFLHMRAVDANGLMQLLAGNIKFLGPIVDIGREFRVDFIRIVRDLLFR